MNSYKDDRIENEKPEPLEGSSLKVINIPLVLLALFFGFGVTYLFLRTEQVSMKVGDSRTVDDSHTEDEAVAQVTKLEEQMGRDELMAQGKQVFTTTCQACHQANGKGIPGAFPPLEKSKWVTGSPKRLIAIVLHGLQGEIEVNGSVYNSVMPAFEGQLSNKDIASVATYIRNSFGNSAKEVSVDMVGEVQSSTSKKKSPWNGEKELNEKKWK